MAEKRVLTEEQGRGLQIADLVLVAVLLAAGAVLKLFVGMFFTGGVKPNFIIASYCMALLLIRPKNAGQGVVWGLIIGLIAGAICQIPILNGTPMLNFVSEALGGIVIGAIAGGLAESKLPVLPLIATFVATVVSGSTFSLLAIVVKSMDFMAGVIQYAPIVLGTATINAIIVQILILPLKAALKK